MRNNKANNIPRKKSCIISVAILRRNFIRGILKSQFRRIVQFVRPVSWKLCSLLFTMPKLFDKLDIYNQPHPQSVLFSFCGLLVFLGAYFGWVEQTGCLYSIAIWQLHQQTGRKKFISRAFEPPVNVFVWSAKKYAKFARIFRVEKTLDTILNGRLSNECARCTFMQINRLANKKTDENCLHWKLQFVTWASKFFFAVPKTNMTVQRSIEQLSMFWWNFSKASRILKHIKYVLVWKLFSNISFPIAFPCLVELFSFEP